MIQELLDILNTVGQVADTPGAFARTALAGQNPFESVFDTDKRVSGRDLLERYGILDANQEGLDLGDVAGVATEFVTDPLNLIGAGLAGRAGMANKAIRAGNEANLLRHGEESALAGLHNYDVDAAYRKLDEMLSGVPKDTAPPNSIINADAIPDIVRNNWAETGPKEMSEAELWAIAHGAPHEVADSILGNYSSTREAAHPVAQELGSKAQVSAFGYPRGTLQMTGGEVKGFVPTYRPDVMFVSNGYGLPSTINTSVHELLHTMSRRDPFSLTALIENAGPTVQGAVNKDRFGGGMNAILGQLQEGLNVNREESIANVFGNSAMRGASKQRFPVTDALNVDFQDVIPEYASLIKERYPMVNDPHSMAAKMLEYIFGPKKQSNALVPVGALQDLSTPQSFSQGTRMTGDELASIRSGYQPLPEDPFFTPTNSQKPLAYLMSMLNALTVPERASHQ